jgi:hypothetical protein
MATSELQKSVDRARGILCQLLKALPPAEREKHLARHLTDIQSWTDAVMGTLGTERAERAPLSIRDRLSVPSETPYVSDASTVPGAVRAEA